MAEPTAIAAPAAECRLVDDAWSLHHHHRIRAEVFVEEQGLFDPDDRDGHDDDPSTLKVLALWDGQPAGTVRLYPLEPGSRLWQGDRLAVAHPYRRHSTGAPLVRFAVATAGRLGGQRMVAHIQPANVGFFRRLGWRTDGAREIYVGVEHQPMVIDL